MNKLLAAVVTMAVSPQSCSDTTTDPPPPPPAKAIGCFQEVAIETVRFGSAAPKVRVQVLQQCSTATVIATQLTDIRVWYRESRFGGEWFEVGSQPFTEVPGREHTYSYSFGPCESGRYRVKVSQAGTFDSGKEFRASDERSASLDCEKARDIS
ncbi:hypothetical protein [Nonomuraea typhae]|uniref:Uncharacterized protein n=1 Tax=Nonomuraea typhae TaxID=2603600 RepID=A0ABW7YS04_9ACTN